MTQHLDPARSTWHITFETYGTRLHGGHRPTVQRKHNQDHEPFVYHDAKCLARSMQRMKHEPIFLTTQQRCLIQDAKPVKDEAYLNNVYAYIRRQRTVV